MNLTRPPIDPPRAPEITRRRLLSGTVLAAAGVAGTATLAGDASAQAIGGRSPPVLPAPTGCFLTPQSVEGPFPLDPGLTRADITQGRAGAPLGLLFEVLDGASCRPVEGARVAVWHTDAGGVYSGYERQGDDGRLSTVGETFLRGAQATDAAGQARFSTIYPGWYRGRTPHIHYKVALDGRTVLVGQMYFPDALSEFIYRNAAPYAERRGQRDTFNATDGIARADGPEHVSFCSIKEERDRYLASLVVGIDPAAKALADRRPPGPPPFGGGGPMGRPPRRPEGQAVPLVPGLPPTRS